MMSSSPPRGPKGSPILGHALSLSHDALEFLRSCAGAYGDLVPLRFLRKPILFVNHPDYIAHVLATNHQKVVKGIARRSDHALIGDGISLREGDSWLRERRIMQSSFQREDLAAHGADMVALTARMIGTWRDGEVRDTRVDMSNLAITIVGKTLFGIDVQDDATGLPEALTFAMECRDARVRSIEMLVPGNFPTLTNLRLRHARRKIDDIVDRFIQERRGSRDDRSDLLSKLLSTMDEDGQRMTNRQVRDEITTIFVGGNDTVADTLSWAWYLLSQHPAVEAKVVAELDATLGGRAPAPSDLPRLPYTSMVVSEVLRLYPPASVLIREATADFDIGTYRVAKGTQIVVSPWVMHRDVRYFAHPDAFNPDRWADGLARRIPRYTYFPFGGGPRLCIGRSFATMEVVLVLASVAQHFQLELLPGHPVIAEEIPTLHPKYGLQMVVHRRQRGQASVQPSEMS